MNVIWNSFFREMEKVAMAPMTVAMHSMNLLNLKSKIKQSNQMTTLNPLKQSASNLKLQSPYQYQFEGGKKTGLTETTTPHTF